MDEPGSPEVCSSLLRLILPFKYGLSNIARLSLITVVVVIYSLLFVIVLVSDNYNCVKPFTIIIN